MTRINKFHCARALLSNGWATDVVVSVADGGIIESIVVDQPATDDAVPLGTVIPGMPNVHSHAFQRGMAGLAERKGPNSFWSWRDLMYRFVQQLSPGDVGVIARYLFSELLAGGFTTIGEFHYLHHQTDGSPYDDVCEMSEQLIAAALDVGLRICHLPTLYTYAGFDQSPLAGGQLRFANQTERLLTMHQQLTDRYRDNPLVTIGLAAHSLRAVNVDQLRQLQQYLDDGHTNCLHIHIAEQQREVDDCLAAHQARPVEFLFSNVKVDERWCLIHATHLSDQEVALIANSGATAGLCPATEANLGDGVFRGADYVAANGDWAIGTDSHVCVNAAEELRMLEYSQRLVRQQRNVISRGEEETGQELYCMAATGGARALALPVGSIAEGHYADLVELDGSHPMLAGRTSSQALSAMVFSAGPNLIQDVFVGGKQVVKEGRSLRKFDAPYSDCLRKILARIN